MKIRNKLLASLFIWAFILLLGSGAELNEKPWFAFATLIVTMTLVFTGKRLYTRFVSKK